jgi:hypothetical protein
LRVGLMSMQATVGMMAEHNNVSTKPHAKP